MRFLLGLNNFGRAALLVTGVLLAVFPARAAEKPSAAELEFFEKNIRPVLAQRCWDCHSKDNAESGLRLDTLAGMLKGGTRGPAIVPKKAKSSLLVLAINHADQLNMPPKSKMPQREIDQLTDWIERGAHWPGEETAAAATPSPAAGARTVTAADRDFWSFRPIQRPAVPAVENPDRVASPIDAFLLQVLEQKGLKFTAPADKRTLIRRATFDLTGLPPTPDEVADFLADERPEAFEKLVDRLLASPRYGQRWGRHWLDLARYGDSNGLDENLAFANAFRYRDYVVDAYNADLPYNQFLAEQIAGDLMPSDDPETERRRLVATGFLSLGAKMLAEDDPVKMEMDMIDEQLETLGKAVLGMTFGCARCHDHKFDPILATDYYALAGIFKSTKTMDNFNVVARWQERPAATAEEIAERDAKRAIAQQRKAKVDEELAVERTRILSEVRAKTALYLLAADRGERLQKRATLVSRAPDGNVSKLPGGRLIEAEQFQRGNVARDFSSYGREIGVLVNQGATPNFVEYDVTLDEGGLYQLDLRYAADGARPCRFTINGAVAKADVAGQVTGGWNPDSQQWFVEGVFRLEKGKNVLRLEHPQFFPHIDKIALAPATDDRLPADVVVAIDNAGLISEVTRRWQKRLADEGTAFAAFRHFAKAGSWDGFDPATDPLAELLLADPKPNSLKSLADRYAEVLLRGNSSPAVTDVVKRLRETAGPWSLEAIPETEFAPTVAQTLAQLRAEHQAAEQEVPVLPEAMAVSEGVPTELRVHLRGSHVTLGESTSRRFPVLFDRGRDPRINSQESGRRALAEWLTAPDNPLTARVMANRIWQHHFGEGLVRSPDNFGRLGEAPSHPELLDWLADELRQDWSMKRMHRRILLSAAWQQGSGWSERGAEMDPENRLLWRFPRRRLEAEAIRDSLLFVGGSLDERFGGSLLPTKNRAYVTSTANVNPQIYVSTRRTLYLPVVRSAIYDFLVAFDFGDPSTMSGRRDRTTVAPQALYLMNSTTVAEQSKALAERTMAASSTDGDRVRQLFEILFARLPSDAESARAEQFVAAYASETDLPRAWQALCRALMTTNEFLYVN